MSQHLAQRAVDAIEIVEAGEALLDQVVAALDLIACLKRWVKQVDQRLEAAVIEWINKNGEIVIGDIRYYVGTQSHTKCNDIKNAVEAVLRAVGGDVDGLVACIASDGLKPGATRETVGEDAFNRLFTKIVMPDLKTGRPLERLQRIDTKFLE